MGVQTIKLDVAIFGAGIAGLWTLARLRHAGYRAALFERRALGGVQSIASQGIIHGGTKYALAGKLTGSAMAIGEMPGIWRAALAGDGEIDLRGTEVLSQHQYLWTTGSLASGMAGFFAGKVMQSRMRSLARADYPPPFDQPGFGGKLYRLEEPVLNPRSLMDVMRQRVGDRCFLTTNEPGFERRPRGWYCVLEEGREFEARTMVLAAGRGNADLLRALGRSSPKMQIRPLNMPMLRGELPPLYAHCLGTSANPRLTATSNRDRSGRMVWYLGGQVAEQGVGRSRDEQIRAGRDELAELLPWLDFADAQWTTLEIDRAEVAQPGGGRPDDAYVDNRDGVITCWPTKLAFAPRVASLVDECLRDSGVLPSEMDGVPDRVASSWPHPPLSELPWDVADAWN